MTGFQVSAPDAVLTGGVRLLEIRGAIPRMGPSTWDFRGGTDAQLPYRFSARLSSIGNPRAALLKSPYAPDAPHLSIRETCKRFARFADSA